MNTENLDPGVRKILTCTHHDPFSVLGRHPHDNGIIIRAHIPFARQVTIAAGEHSLEQLPGTDLFEWHGREDQVRQYYRFIWTDEENREHIAHDPYCFPPQLSDYDIHLFAEGTHSHAYRFMGAHPVEVENIAGILFSVWAPNAGRVSVVGDFNCWDGRMHPMRVRGGSGVWELFIPDLASGCFYKFEIRNRHSGKIQIKSDPYGRSFELRPKTASIVLPETSYTWRDAAWIEKRRNNDWLKQPMSIYEVHLGSWQRGSDGEFLNYRELAHRLTGHVKKLGFSHIQLLPVTEHPFDGSWGYQTTGNFAPTSRFGSADDFRYFVDYCHCHDISVLLDWVPAHFPKDAHGLARFDGEALYEYADPRKGEHIDWSTLIYNFGRHEVRSYLISSANYWIEAFHIDGLRVDAVASMLYLDYSRNEGEWIPNEYGGRENLEALHFLRELNTVIHGEHPGVLVIAEESTSWPKVTRPVNLDGLGFSMKWNMGWMNDTLEYMTQDPVHRRYHHNKLTFSMLYAFTENFVLPFSHDEVVHGKQSMLNKMPGDEWQRFANLRLAYSYMFTHPGKKLLFMGCEFGQGLEWNCAGVLDWYVLEYPLHQGIQTLVGDLNRLYHKSPALYQSEFDWQGFEWIDCHEEQLSILSFLRKSEEETMVVLLNFTPVARHDYRIGVPDVGDYIEVFNSDSAFYGGSNMGNGNMPCRAEKKEWMGRPYSMSVTLPPLACVIFKTGDGEIV